MPLYSFVRTVPVVVTVEAPDEQTAWTESGHRLDDFMARTIDIRSPLHLDTISIPDVPNA